MKIGKLVKDRRKELNLTQIQLAKDICTQAMVSKIEKGIINPSSQLLKQLSDRLDVPVSYFYRDDEDRYLEKIEKDILGYLNQNELQKAGEALVKHRDIFFHSKNDYYHLFYKMIEIYTTYDKNKNTDNTIKVLNELIEKLTHRPLLHLDSLVLLAVVQYDSGNFNEANETFQELLALMTKETKLPLRIRILYSYALNLEALGKEDEALEVVVQTIDEAIKKQSLYNLGYLYYRQAILLSKKDRIEESKVAYENAAFIYKIKGYQKMHNKVNKELDKL